MRTEGRKEGRDFGFPRETLICRVTRKGLCGRTVSTRVTKRRSTHMLQNCREGLWAQRTWGGETFESFGSGGVGRRGIGCECDGTEMGREERLRTRRGGSCCCSCRMARCICVSAKFLPDFGTFVPGSSNSRESSELGILSTNSDQIFEKKNQLNLKSSSHKPLTPISLSFANLLTLLGATQIWSVFRAPSDMNQGMYFAPSSSEMLPPGYILWLPRHYLYLQLTDVGH